MSTQAAASVESESPWGRRHRLLRALERVDWKLKDMQDYLGVSDTTMTAYIHDRNKRGIPLAVYRSWAAKTGTRVEWLKDGTGPWLRSLSDPDGASDLRGDASARHRRVPKIAHLRHLDRSA